MARKQHLPADLSPAQVIALQDALLANADRLLQAALAMLERDNVPLARSLAILGMEESGKAIALHERRVRMADAPEGESFVDQGLRELWGQHVLKLEAVHAFLVSEEYWFDAEMPDREENARVLGTIQEWKREHNVLKQRGFYVDVTAAGEPVTPQETADAEAVRAVIGHVHQIGWQLRLGEHIEGKSQLQRQQDVPPASEEEIESTRRHMRSVDPEIVERIVESMREGTRGEKLNNSGYAFVLPEHPFETVGRPGYEAQDRELWALMNEPSESGDAKPEG
ncbi:AbiV family abortive infection protein [Ornithinimicrobium sediminis]|uniref:AbiV family abortive infection protein n=1 Tax=Ornithinimicrobium sediminis TaxID=2904603 RepID=UPI001E4A4711|nr:AbiV family abortive infection protein [Ornithinimicrobium sediminis]MCE0485452.1 AbiV family abortive infection protein [Ornithinimicrobium sediminis]